LPDDRRECLQRAKEPSPRMTLVVASLVVVVPLVGVVVVLAISEVEHRLKVAMGFLEELIRLKDINERLAGLESDVSRIRRAISPSYAGYRDVPHTTVQQMLGIIEGKKKNFYVRATGTEIDRALDQFESEQSL